MTAKATLETLLMLKEDLSNMLYDETRDEMYERLESMLGYLLRHLEQDHKVCRSCTSFCRGLGDNTGACKNSKGLRVLVKPTDPGCEHWDVE